MTPGLGIEPGTHWWKVSALTIVPTLLPVLCVIAPTLLCATIAEHSSTVYKIVVTVVMYRANLNLRLGLA